MKISRPADIHAAVEEAFNAKDLDGLLALYEEGAHMATMDGSVVSGVAAIREQWQGFLAMDGRMTVTTRFVIELPDLALLRNDWTFSSAAGDISSSTAEVVRRQTDGSWRYVMDHPFGSSDLLA